MLEQVNMFSFTYVSKGKQLYFANDYALNRQQFRYFILKMIMLILEVDSQNLFIGRSLIKNDWRGFPGGAVVKNPPAYAGDTGLSPGQEDPTCHGATKPVQIGRAHV